MGKKNLKAALQSTQSRLRAKQKAAQAAQAAELKARKQGPRPSRPKAAMPGTDVKGKGKQKTVPGPHIRRLLIPFKLSDKILLIGEGNFSFARALVINPPAELRSLPPSSITATAYDTQQECFEKYPEAEGIVSTLKDKGVEVLFGVDGTRLEKNASLKGRKWNRIVWNFPHAGKGIADQDRNILSNQLLILGFLRSAAKMLQLGPKPIVPPSKKKQQKAVNDDDDSDIILHDGFAAAMDMDDTEEQLQFLSQPSDVQTRGTILVTLRNVAPYTEWDLPRLAKCPPLPTAASAPPNPQYILRRSFKFYRDIWEGYEHRMTKGERAHGKGKTGEGGEDRMWEFYLKDKDSD
ncbi:hypothetical protein BDN70DRAFT_846165 [Pholiota conissans]|uniref:25S rRNA (uridine-N(3))-methyltransferase BMT5-like domain-containing protein n=1 Tax=Pholiota conissans TaxID=109636 RepID=A0A9P6D0I6_9AGAR|nr:hypothetical protein BDN70DRAFT_846165 [Pholiota conissans]